MEHRMIWNPVHTLYRRQWVPRGLHETFEFFERPENLARITPPWLAFRILTPAPIRMTRGLTIDYTVRVLGMRRHWRSLISEYDPPSSFRDVQVIGPYRLWDHQHRFRREQGGTAVEDFVVYELPPLGPLGALLNRLAVRSRLDAIFDYRQAQITSLLGLAEESPAPPRRA
jgi:ligand-binding SRPBCC domain-containing protein